VRDWQRSLVSQGLAPSTVNNHLASLSAFTTGANAQDPKLFPAGDPAKGIGELGLPPLDLGRSLPSSCVRSRVSATGWSASTTRRGGSGRPDEAMSRLLYGLRGGRCETGPSCTSCSRPDSGARSW
jgi:hypothetical protein